MPVFAFKFQLFAFFLPAAAERDNDDTGDSLALAETLTGSESRSRNAIWLPDEGQTTACVRLESGRVWGGGGSC